MNIFAVHPDSKIAASMLCDSHCNKMVLESAQMLANCFSLEDLQDAPHTQKGTPRKYSYWNHPCSLWVRKTKSNMRWLIDHAIELENQRLIRGMNPHFSYAFILWCRDHVDFSMVPDGPLTEFAIAISEDKNCRKLPKFDSFSIVQKYRSYICFDKPFAEWRNCEEPVWRQEYLCQFVP